MSDRISSHFVADQFGKPHEIVIRDIEALDIGGDLHRSWFRPITALNSKLPAYDMSREGVLLLAMIWAGATGAAALSFAVHYVQAFEAALCLDAKLLAEATAVIGPLADQFASPATTAWVGLASMPAASTLH
jgi:Rha family phage regulatory protein